MHFIDVIAMTPPPSGQGGAESFLPTIFMFGSVILIFYFMILRPQKKRQDEVKNMLNEIKKGDKVVMSSGIHGTISEVEETSALVQIADNVRIRVEKQAIASVVEKKG